MVKAKALQHENVCLLVVDVSSWTALQRVATPVGQSILYSSCARRWRSSSRCGRTRSTSSVAARLPCQILARHLSLTPRVDNLAILNHDFSTCVALDSAHKGKTTARKTWPIQESPKEACSAPGTPGCDDRQRAAVRTARCIRCDIALGSPDRNATVGMSVLAWTVAGFRNSSSFNMDEH